MDIAASLFSGRDANIVINDDCLAGPATECEFWHSVALFGS
ncbi:hypothetical protein SAMN02745729_10126 [Marinobacterium iners DSM 11526]|uniref:Uncharacterized protein n=1 Tax=Marinobacterium iners DSM 11526 TaxID=1122198 RepID=A0A1H3X3J7_9GAMM|nr:hypothetical protein SAMN02745729_10126 [Marinobacterium iners DSM 11526]